MESPITTNRARTILMERIPSLTKPPRRDEITLFFTERETNGETTIWEQRSDFEKQVEQAENSLKINGELTL